MHAGDVAALALGTWMLYVLDRMLDARLGVNEQHEDRHYFHGTNQIAFLCAMACAVPVLLVLLMHMQPMLLHAYLLLGLVLAAYFALIHTRPLAQRMPKEAAVGVIFSAAVFMPEWIAGARGVVPLAVCFGVLCWMNCALIYEREHSQIQSAHWSTRFAIRHMRLLLWMLLTAGVGIGVASRVAGASIVHADLTALLYLQGYQDGEIVGHDFPPPFTGEVDRAR